MALLCFGLFWSAAAPAAGLQLPPEVLLDQLLLRTERLIEADDLDAAVEAMDEASTVATEHEPELPPDFRFEHARTAFAVGLLGAAKESVTEYLTVAGREAESYTEAVELLEDVDRILERRDAAVCTPEPEDSECWMELQSHPGCYVWNFDPQPDEAATWTGECSVGFAQGPGTLTWTYREGSQEHQASRRFGQPHGESVVRYSDGGVSEGPSRFGTRHGRWVLRFADGDVEEGPFVNGKREGHWMFELADGGRQEGPYVDGEKNGHWILKFTDDRGIQEGPYKDGVMHGRWVQRFASGNVGEGPYVDGKRHGHWVLRFTDDRGIQEGPYKDGEMHGEWVLRFADGQVERGPYANGERHGRWRVAFPDGEVDYVEFVHGVRQEP